MGKTEPTFVPEWLKNSGSLTTASHQSSSLSDDKFAPKSVRNKPLDNDLGRPTTGSYFRRPCNSNGTPNSRSYSSFGRARDRDWVKVKEKPENRVNRRRDYSESLANILPSWFDKDGVAHSHSDVSAKRAESWARKLGSEKTGNVSFERDFPSLGPEEKQVGSEAGPVGSPVWSSAIQSLPVGSSGCEVWTSALAQVPLVVGISGSTSAAATTNVATGWNMAEARAHGYPHGPAAEKLVVGTQRLEELAVKQSRQLIPVTPMPKSSDKPKLKVVANPRPVPVNAEVTKTSLWTSSGAGKLHVLTPSRERNSVTLVAKETASLTGGGKLPNSPQAGFLDHKPSTPEKRPSPQAKSRNDFFNLMRKKSMTKDTESSNDKAGEGGTESGTVAPFGEKNLSCNATDDFIKNENNHSSSVVIWYSEEEEARFLRSLGWEETTEEEGLTEDEINDFYRDIRKYVHLKTGQSVFKRMQPKCLMPLNLKNGVDS